MKLLNLISKHCPQGLVIAAAVILFCGCVYDVPITKKPTPTIEPRLLGDGKSGDGKDTLKVARLDHRNYIALFHGDLYRDHHSDVAKTPFVTVVGLAGNDTDAAEHPKYSFYSWRLTGDGSLHARLVNDKIVPDDTKTSSQVRELLRQNLEKPELFGDDVQMIRIK